MLIIIMYNNRKPLHAPQPPPPPACSQRWNSTSYLQGRTRQGATRRRTVRCRAVKGGSGGSALWRRPEIKSDSSTNANSLHSLPNASLSRAASAARALIQAIEEQLRVKPAG